ncbi:hypothetical protein [Calidithermus chliarophilus]|uniref:hypothetical protein n=1 Tax=Calidithermus chliarophilus TaxID=52023 RepID=UPI000687F0FC|nr:hypothetical protein [Calidithermus chliarophilus]
MEIDAIVTLRLEVPDDTDLDDLVLEIDEEGRVQFVAGGEVVADGASITDYSLDDVEEVGDDEDDDYDEEDEDEEDEDEDDEDEGAQ